MKFSQFTYRGKALITMITLTLIMLPILMAQQKPSDYFGFQPGSDRNLFTYEELISYLQELDEVSDKLKMVEILLKAGRCILHLFPPRTILIILIT